MTGGPGEHGQAAGTTPREAWIDVAKGIAISLVVLYHSVMYLDRAGVTGALAPLNPLLDTFRMPLFFFMSGLLATQVVRLPYRDLFRKRMLLLLYLYVIWVTVQTLVLVAMPQISPGAVNARWGDLFTLFIRPNSNLWFIYALPLFLTIAWLLRRWHPVLQVSAAAILAAAFGAGLLHTASPWDKMGRYLVFFIAAIWLGPTVRSLVPRVRWWHAIVFGVVYAAVVVFMVKLSLVRLPFALLVMSVLAVAVGISIAVVLCRIAAFDFLRALGTLTLPIYLVHAVPMMGLAAVIVGARLDLPEVAATVLPLLLGVVAIAVALGGHRLFAGVPGVFTVPVAAWTAGRRTLGGDGRGPTVAG
jgi:uncharacterized membrane protein YcfT